MAQKRKSATILIEDSDEEEQEKQPSKSSSDGEDDSDEESEEVEDDGEEEVEDDGVEEEEVDGEEEEDDCEEEEEDDGEEEDEDEDDEEEEGEDDGEEEVDDDDDDDDGDGDLQKVEGKEEFSSKESIRKLLELFVKDKLIEIIKEATLKNSRLLSRALSTFECDPARRKIFVHGLASDATSEEVAAAFSPFGEIEDCTVIVFPNGKCKGYGFVLFKYSAAAARALKDPLKRIGSRTVNCHLASSGSQDRGGNASSDARRGNASSDTPDRKIIVYNISKKVKPRDLRTFFSKYGEIEEGPLGCDPVSGKLLGFAVFVYKSEEGCKKALEEPNKFFQRCNLFCRKPPASHNKNNNAQMTTSAGTQATSSGLQANAVTQNFGSGATLMGQNLGQGQITCRGQNLGSGTTMSSGQHFGEGPTALIGKNIGPGSTSFVRQNGVPDHFNPAAGLYPAMSAGASIAPAHSHGFISANRGSGLGLNKISSSVMDNYGTLSALHGLGAFQNSSSSTTLKPQSGVGYLGKSRLPHSFGP